MEAHSFGIIVKVNDLDGCRLFYREQLGFGEPVADSTYRAVFDLGGGLTLTLEKSAAPYLERASAATGWCFRVPDLKAFRDRLEAAGYEYPIERSSLGDGDCLRGSDPEGNLFLVREG